MPSRSKRALSVPQRSSQRLGHHSTNSTGTAHQRRQKGPPPCSNGLDELRRKSSRLQLPDSVDRKNNQSTSDVRGQELQKNGQDLKHRGENSARKQAEQQEDLKDLREPQPQQKQSQKSENVNGNLSNLKNTSESEVFVSTDDRSRGLMRRQLQKQVDGHKYGQMSEQGKQRKKSHLEGEKVEEGTFQTASCGRRYPSRKGKGKEDSFSRQSYPLRKRTISHGHSRKENNRSSSSGIEKKGVLKGLKEIHKVPCPEVVLKASFPLIQWLPSPVVKGIGFEKNSYTCLNCALEFQLLRNFIQHCIPTSKVPCYVCGDVADCTCKERIHHLADHQFICFYCHERFATQEAAKHHRRFIHPDKPEKTSSQQHPTFHGKAPIDLLKMEKPSVTTYIVILGKMRSVTKYSMPWVFGVVDSVAHLTKEGIAIQCDKFLYKMNEALVSETLRKRAVMCPLCFQGFVGFDSVEEHMVDVHRPNSLKAFKPSVKIAKLPNTTTSPSSDTETIPVSSSTSSSLLGSSKTTHSAFCHPCQKVFQDETSLGRHNVIVHSLSTVHKKALAQKAREDIKYNVSVHMCDVCKVPFTSEKSLKRHMTYSQHGDIEDLPDVAKSAQLNPKLTSSSAIHAVCSGNVHVKMPVEEKRCAVQENSDSERGKISASNGTTSVACKENTGHVLNKETHKMLQSECHGDEMVDASKKEGKECNSSRSESSDGSSLKVNAARKAHPDIVKSREPQHHTSTASWHLPKALFSSSALHNASHSVNQEVDKLIQDALNSFGVEKQMSLRSPHATADRYKFSRAIAAYLKLKPVLQNPPRTPTARRNYEFNHKYKIPMGHLNPEFADCPLFPTLTDIFRRTNAYTLSPLRVLTPQEIKKSVAMSSKSKGKIAKRFSKALESTFMSESEHWIAKATRGHVNFIRASAMQAHSYLSGKVSALVNERINKAVIRESQSRFVTPGISTGHFSINPNQASVSGMSMVSNGMPMNHQHGMFAVGANKSGPYYDFRGRMLQGQGMVPTVGGYFEMPLEFGNSRALFSVNARGYATVVGVIPGPRTASSVDNPPRTFPLGYSRGAVVLPHTAAHGSTTSLNQQVPIPANSLIANPVKAHVTSPGNPLAISGQCLPVVNSYLAQQSSSALHAPSQRYRPPPLVDLTKPEPGNYCKGTVKEHLERKKAAMLKGEAVTKVSIPTKAQEAMVSTKEMTSVSNAVNTRPNNGTLGQVMPPMESSTTNSGVSQTSQRGPKDSGHNLKRSHQPPLPGLTPRMKKLKKVVVVPSAEGSRFTADDILKRNAGKRIVQIKKKRLPSSDWCVTQLHIRMHTEARLRKKIWLHKKYKKRFVPTKEIKQVPIHTTGIHCKAGNMDTVMMVSEAVKRAKRAKICLDDFQDLCDKFGFYGSSDK